MKVTVPATVPAVEDFTAAVSVSAPVERDPWWGWQLTMSLSPPRQQHQH